MDLHRADSRNRTKRKKTPASDRTSEDARSDQQYTQHTNLSTLYLRRGVWGGVRGEWLIGRSRSFMNLLEKKRVQMQHNSRHAKDEQAGRRMEAALPVSFTIKPHGRCGIEPIIKWWRVESVPGVGCICYGYLFVWWAQCNVCGWVQVVSQRAHLFSISTICSLPWWRSDRKVKYVINTQINTNAHANTQWCAVYALPVMLSAFVY